MTNADCIKLWANDKSRRTWLKTWQIWRIVGQIDELKMYVFAYDLPNGRRLYAIETPSSYDPETPRVTYHLTHSNGAFSQRANGESEIAGVLMDIKNQLREGKL
jgi:hypothetical protein